MKNITFFSAGFIAGALSMFLFSCEFTDMAYYIDPRLEVYVDRFYSEAKARGVQLERVNLMVRIEPLPGRAARSKREGCQRVVIFSKDTWDFMNNPVWVRGDSVDAGIENIVFHELGHALLDRKHCDPCESIMAAGYSYFTYVDKPEVRKSALDELFKGAN
jgi:hypothetical protein